MLRRPPIVRSHVARRAGAAALVALGLAGCAVQPPPPRRVLMVVVDTLRADRLGVYGYDRDTSPNLDRLAARGAVLLNARSTSSWTQPAVASLFTGFGPETHGMESGGVRAVITGQVDALDERFTTLAEAMRDGGLLTAAWVSNPHLSAATGLDRGFDVFVRGGMRGDDLVDRFVRWLEEPESAGDAWRGERRSFDPAVDGWFAYLHLMHPHLPYPEEPELADRFPLRPGPPVAISEPALRRVGRQALPGVTDLREYEARYDRAVFAADRQVGRALDALAARGLLDTTLVVVLSDHGEEFLEHGALNHGRSLYDELLRVPLLVAYPPAVPAGRRIAAPVDLLDLFPTLVGWLGLATGGGGPGMSLLGALTGREELADRPLTLTHLPLDGDEARRLHARIEGDRKLIFRAESERIELYDLIEDPGETLDLWQAEPRTARRLLDGLREERRRRALLGARVVPERRPVPDELLRQLEALGYLDDAEAPGS